MPVLGYQGAVAADYDRLMKGGFLLERSYNGRGLRAVRAERRPVLGRCRQGRPGVPVLRWRPRSGRTLQ